jgi:cytochrome b involved in lipid metabolism
MNSINKKIILIGGIILILIVVGALFYLNVQKRSSLLINEKTQRQINNLFENKGQEINSQEENLVEEQIVQRTDQQQLIQTSTQPQVAINQKKSRAINQKESQAINQEVSATSTKDYKEDQGKSYTMEEVSKHNSKESCWSVIRGEVYDLTSWVNKHPGGPDRILRICGKDGTDLFIKQHGEAERPENILRNFKIGVLKK